MVIPPSSGSMPLGRSWSMVELVPGTTLVVRSDIPSAQAANAPVTVTSGTAGVVLAQSVATGPRVLFLTNVGAAPVHLGFGATPTKESRILAPGESFPAIEYRGEVRAIVPGLIASAVHVLDLR